MYISCCNQVAKGYKKSYKGWHCNGSVNELRLSKEQFEECILKRGNSGKNNPRYDKCLYKWKI